MNEETNNEFVKKAYLEWSSLKQEIINAWT